MKKIFLLVIFVAITVNLNAQVSIKDSIKLSVVGFLKWHKVNHLHDPSPKRYTLVRELPVSKKIKKRHSKLLF